MSRLSDLILKMTEYEDGCLERVNHFLKVWAFAKVIAEGEGFPEETREILEAAAVVHDIGIRVCLEKYGHCRGPAQEKEGPPLALAMLPLCGYTAAETARVCFLVGHHHTAAGVEGDDWRALLEADFLVNAFEGGMQTEAVRAGRRELFRTKTGLRLLDAMYFPGDVQ